MRASLRFWIAFVAAALAVAPAAAQDNRAATTNTPATDAVGPTELRDFSLNGTVTRPAPEPAPPPAARQTPPASVATPPAGTARPAPPPAPTGPGDDRSLAAPSATPGRSQEAGSSLTVPLPPPAGDGAAEPTPSFTTQPNLAPPIIPEAAAQLPSDRGPSLWPWLLAALLLGGAAAYYAWRQQGRAVLAGRGDALEPYLPAERRPEPLARTAAPQPDAAPARPRAAPPAPAAAPTIVSTRLRPQLEIDFAPGRCIIDQRGARIEFEVSLFNPGNAPARDVLLEGCMFNAGPAQDQEIGAFFAHPVGAGNRVAVLEPLKRMTISSAAALPVERMRMFEVAGRRLFVPLVGFNALYRWSGGEGQTSASYLVGRDTGEEKMAPFRLDLGPRVFRGLGAREHHLKLRK